MNEHLDPTDNKFTPEENDIDRALRPLNFDDFAGQESILENLKIIYPMLKKMRMLVCFVLAAYDVRKLQTIFLKMDIKIFIC